MTGTVLRKAASALRETYCAWVAKLRRDRPESHGDGWEHRISIGRYRDELYVRAKLGSL